MRERRRKTALILGAVTAIAMVVAAISTVLIYLDNKRKKEDEELEHYLDNVIQ